MSKKEPIIPSGEKGWEFEKKGYQEKNINNLISILDKRESRETLQQLSKVQRETWRDIAETTTSLRDIVVSGGLATLSEIFKGRVEEVLKNQLEDALAPIKNSLTIVVDTYMKPAYDLISVIATQTAGIIDDGQYGALGGALIGQFFGGDVGEFFGGIAGAYVQIGLERFWGEIWPKMWGDIARAFKDFFDPTDIKLEEIKQNNEWVAGVLEKYPQLYDVFKERGWIVADWSETQTPEDRVDRLEENAF